MKTYQIQLTEEEMMFVADAMKEYPNSAVSNNLITEVTFIALLPQDMTKSDSFQKIATAKRAEADTECAKRKTLGVPIVQKFLNAVKNPQEFSVATD